jgi:phenylalanyl-tRNA synthetase beta chain
VIDASKRFENEPSRALPPLAQQEIVDLISKIAGGECVGMIDEYPNKKQPLPVTLEPAQVCALLGVEISTPEIVSILRRVGVLVVENSDNTLTCTGPVERTDLNLTQDFIEEVGRVYGYHHIVSVVPTTVPLAEINSRHYHSELVRDALTALGFSEVVTSSFRDTDVIGLESSLASDKSFLRSALAPAISDGLTKNAPLIDVLGTIDTRIFEIGTVFTNDGGTVAEHFSLALGVRLKTTGYSGKEDKIIAAAIVTLAPILGSDVSWTTAQGVSECNLSHAVALLPIPTSYNQTPAASVITFESFSVYPSMSRDIAMWVEEMTDTSAVEAVLSMSASPLLARLTHTDSFTNAEGRTSIAYRLVFQSKEKTLDSSEVDALMESVYAAAAKAGFEVR